MSGQKKLPLVHCFTARFARSDGAGRSCSKRGFACEGVLLEAHFRDLNVHRINGLRYMIWSRRRSSPTFPSVAKIQGRVAAPQHRGASLRLRVLQALPLADTFVFVPLTLPSPMEEICRHYPSICRNMSGTPSSLEEMCFQLLEIRFPTVPIDFLWRQLFLIDWYYSRWLSTVVPSHSALSIVVLLLRSSAHIVWCRLVFAPPQPFEIPPGLVTGFGFGRRPPTSRARGRSTVQYFV